MDQRTPRKRPSSEADQSRTRGAGAEASPGPDERDVASVLRLQQKAGNSAVQRALHRGAPVQREGIDFSDEPTEIVGHVATIGREEGNWTARTNMLAGRFHRAVNNMRDRTTQALGQFETYMAFPSSAEADADYVGAATTVVVDEAWKALFSWAIPGVGGQVYDAAKAILDEHERARQTAQRVQVRDWIIGQKEVIAQKFDAMQDSKRMLEMDMARAYDDAVRAGQAEGWMGGQGRAAVGETKEPTSRTKIQQHDVTVSGPGAQFLNETEERLTRLEEAVLPTGQMFLAMVERWVNQQRNQLGSKGGARIYFQGNIYMTVKGKRSGDSVAFDPSVTPKLASIEGGRTVDALTRAMAQTNTTVNDIAIRKVLRVEVEDEDSGRWFFNDRYRTTLFYYDPGAILEQAGPLGPRGKHDQAVAIMGLALRQLDLSQLQFKALENY